MTEREKAFFMIGAQMGSYLTEKIDISAFATMCKIVGVTFELLDELYDEVNELCVNGLFIAQQRSKQ